MSFLPPMYGIEFLVALLGNALALWLMVTRERRDWHTGVVFSCNLAISDLLYIFTLPLMVVYYVRGKNWSFGSAACKAERFLFTCNLYVSILFIMCISLNRYVAIVHPFFAHRRVRPVHAKVASLSAWLLVLLISTPVLHFAGTCPSLDSSKTECVSSCQHDNHKVQFCYNVFLATLGGLLPFLLTLLSYGAIVWVVCKNHNITALEKRKVATLVASVLVVYAVSVVPYLILRNVHLYNKMWKQISPRSYNAYQVTKGLVTFSTCVHPILYMAVFDSIRTVCCGANGGGQPQKRGGVAPESRPV
ncbi:P2Y purinoceptor 11-like [Scleropages formosus]|nr:P2Y purinoceptor 11-like [Scleropages formosus]